MLLAGEYPGDGKPKPVRFPDPAQVAVPGKAGAFVPLPRTMGDDLDPSVRDKFFELWDAAQAVDPE